ncbi:hypothetical protein [Mesorhizobium erdmanii]|uniref:hypothetical protein n=1 Tax=Mesorhizobium erdmanii TaxID=1777866 RepID=UPI00047B4A0A|nr:hypothetical protein [Mesorhizobium erdmanii]
MSDDTYKTVDSDLGSSGAPEIEITPAMIEAGTAALRLCNNGDERDLIVFMVYSEMVKAKLMEAR